MPYKVMEVTDIYEGIGVEDWLNAQESEGWRLIAVVPDFQIFDRFGNPDSKGPCQLVLHKA